MGEYLNEEIDKFRKNFNNDFKSNIPLLNVILKYIVKSKGKEMRPRFVFTSAAMFGDINDATFAAASLVELLHTATLVHDDVVDDAYQRRSMFSINALWKNKIAVLIGDYLLSKGMINALEGNNFELLKIVSNAVKLMSEGELLQIEKARKLDIEESVYFEIIENKTASLLAAACAAGAYSVTNDLTIKKAMHNFGIKVGIAFQIKDDLFDYGTDDVGKPLGIDIKEQKMTLPLIFTLQKCDKKTKRDIIQRFKNKNTDKASIAYIIDTVKEYGGLEYATNTMHQYIKSAMEDLGKFPESTARDEMKKLVLEVINRKK